MEEFLLAGQADIVRLSILVLQPGYDHLHVARPAQRVLLHLELPALVVTGPVSALAVAPRRVVGRGELEPGHALQPRPHQQQGEMLLSLNRDGAFLVVSDGAGGGSEEERVQLEGVSSLGRSGLPLGSLTADISCKVSVSYTLLAPRANNGMKMHTAAFFVT